MTCPWPWKKGVDGPWLPGYNVPLASIIHILTVYVAWTFRFHFPSWRCAFCIAARVTRGVKRFLCCSHGPQKGERGWFSASFVRTLL